MFDVFKMWIDFLVGLLLKDRGSIPNNIGNSMLITNNLYITKQYLSSMIIVNELPESIPVTFIGEVLINMLRNEGSTVVLDFTMKNDLKQVDLENGSLKTRINLWKKSAEDDSEASDRDRARAVRLLYTVDQVEQKGYELLTSKMLLTLRAKTGKELYEGERLIVNYLKRNRISYTVVTSFIEDYMKFFSLLSNVKSKKVKSFFSTTNTSKTLAQLLPNTHAITPHKGVFLGTNVNNNTPYYYDFRTVNMGRNIYMLTTTGGGKTAMALNIASSALEDRYRLTVMDIKGNEFTNLVDSVGGVTISLRETSNEYFNSFKMVAEDVDKDSELYFKERVNFSKSQLIILSGVQDQQQKVALEGFLDRFLDHLYISLGVSYKNTNTWKFTHELTPFTVYKKLLEYLNRDIKDRYSSIYDLITTNLSVYLTEKGSRSYLFTNELDFNSVYGAKAVRFDFGLLSDNANYDATVFKLKFTYMSAITNRYVTNNYNNDLDTFTILEEVQAVSDDMLGQYSKEFTLRRAQRQTSLLIGNSLNALTSNPKATPIIETSTALLLGKLQKTSIDLLVKHFDVHKRENLIRYMGKTNRYKRHFLFINMMEDNPDVPILHVRYGDKKYKLLTPSKI